MRGWEWFKNQLDKNKEAQNDPKFMNKLSTIPPSKFNTIQEPCYIWLEITFSPPN